MLANNRPHPVQAQCANRPKQFHGATCLAVVDPEREAVGVGMGMGLIEIDCPQRGDGVLKKNTPPPHHAEANDS